MYNYINKNIKKIAGITEFFLHHYDLCLNGKEHHLL
jgi:hypothetical protein